MPGSQMHSQDDTDAGPATDARVAAVHAELAAYRQEVAAAESKGRADRKASVPDKLSQLVNYLHVQHPCLPRFNMTVRDGTQLSGVMNVEPCCVRQPM